MLTCILDAVTSLKMRLPRRITRVVYVCVAFIVVNLLLYLKSEQLFPTNAPPTPKHRGVARARAKTPDPNDFTPGVIDPVNFIQHTLRHHNVSEMFPKTLWPQDTSETSDRIVKQLDFLDILTKGLGTMHPPMTQLSRRHAHASDKIIYVTSGVRMAPWEMRREKLVSDHCPINNCYLIDDPTTLPPGVKRPHAVIYKGALNALKRISQNRTQSEVWIVYQLESPLSASMGRFTPEQKPNWTATFRSSSTLVTPYEKYLPGPTGGRYELDGDDGFEKASFGEKRNFAQGKMKAVAWFVTNCNAQSERVRYAKELGNYIQVDIFGSCGTHTCSKTNNGCFEMLKKDYKFYLAFENSNCREYITEKLYSNALANDIIPIVMGAHPDDYRKLAPPNSYIHSDDYESPRHLAEYLHKLDKNDSLYNEFFRWRGSGAFVNTKFWCRLCAMLHAREIDNYVHSYDDLHGWWTEGACLTPSAFRPGWLSWRSESQNNPELSQSHNATNARGP